MAKKGRKDKARKGAQRSPAGGGGAAEDRADRAVPLSEPSAEPAAATDAAVSEASGSPGPSRWTNAFIVLFLGYQLVMPLRYYLGGRGYDERFSWRMFSTVRMQECRVQVEERVGEQTRAVNLQKAVQIAWINMLERYRRPVVDKLLARRCEEESAREVRYTRTCVDTDGKALPETRVTMDCKSGRFRVEHEHEGRGDAEGAAP